MERREFVQKCSGAVALGLAATAGLMPTVASAQTAWNKAAFESKNLADAVKAMGGSSATESKEVTLSAPEIAENGNVVRLGAQSAMAGTTWLAQLRLNDSFGSDSWASDKACIRLATASARPGSFSV